MGKRITIEIAQERVYNMGRNYTILKWEGTTKESIVRCNCCGLISVFKTGNALYANPNNFSYLNEHCMNCERIRFSNIHIENARLRFKEWCVVLNNTDIIKNLLEENLNKKLTKKDIKEIINKKLGIDLATQETFDDIIRYICEYETITTKSPYIHIIKRVYGKSDSPETQECTIKNNIEKSFKAVNYYIQLINSYNLFKENKIEGYKIKNGKVEYFK